MLTDVFLSPNNLEKRASKSNSKDGVVETISFRKQK